MSCPYSLSVLLTLFRCFLCLPIFLLREGSNVFTEASLNGRVCPCAATAFPSGLNEILTAVLNGAVGCIICGLNGKDDVTILRLLNALQNYPRRVNWLANAGRKTKVLFKRCKFSLLFCKQQCSYIQRTHNIRQNSKEEE